MTELTENRLYNLLPAVYRARDMKEGEPLRALLDLIEGEMQLLAEDIDGLYRDWFIETCDDWVIPYIGDLLGVHAIHSFSENGASTRGYVANTIAYRRRKGTASVLEQVSHDVTGWNAHAVEFFQLLAVTQNLNHLRLDRGKTACVRNANEIELVNGPFETTAHTLAVREIASQGGRYNIPNIGIFLWRLQSYPISQASARSIIGGKNRYSFDPTGLDIPLFNRPQTENLIVQLSQEINVPGPLRRYPLYAELETRRKGEAPMPSYFDPEPVLGIDISDGDEETFRVPIEDLFICNMADEWHYPPLEMDKEIIWVSDFSFEVRADGAEGSGRALFLAEVVELFSDQKKNPGILVTIKKVDRNGSVWLLTVDKDISDLKDDTNCRARRITVAVDPESGRIAITEAASPQTVLVSYYYGFSADVGAGPYDRTASIRQIFEDDIGWQAGVSKKAADGVKVFETVQEALDQWAAELKRGDDSGADVGLIVLMDSRTYDEKVNVVIPEGCKLMIAAADWPRARSKGQFAPRGLRPHLKADIVLEGPKQSLSDTDLEPGELVIDGLLIEGKLSVPAGSIRLHIAHSTLVPSSGGIKIEGDSSVELTIDRSICGRIEVAGKSSSLIVNESIIDADGAEKYPAIDAEEIAARMDRCTILGRSKLRRLEASNSIFTDEVTARLRQEGCVRFSYITHDSHSPRRFHCQPDMALAAAKEDYGEALNEEEIMAVKNRLDPAFTSVHYGDPGYVQLSRSSAQEILKGAEDGSEMGIYGILQQPQREANLRMALEEYLRFGLEAGIFFVT